MRWYKWLVMVVMMVVWLPLVRHLFPLPSAEVQAEALAQTQLSRWERSGGESIASMRQVNPEWDFMSRTFTVLGLANYALKQPADGGSRQRALKVMDTIIDETLVAERQHGSAHFTLGYIHRGRFQNADERSLFIDGEVLMMMAARALVAPAPRRDAEMARRADLIVRHMTAAPLLSGESYPDECWTFCNTTALAALRLYDAASHGDHSGLGAEWVVLAKTRLVEPNSGLLVSSFRYNGEWLDGPEGSSLWMTAHNLLLIDEDFALDQYRRARQQLGMDVLGFGLAREWPQAMPGRMDVDSGPVVPLLGASAGSSGLALLAAASFEDEAYRTSLLRSLEFVAFPVQQDGRLSYAAAGHMGDAVAFYAAQQGPLWKLARQRMVSASRSYGSKYLSVGPVRERIGVR